MSFIVLERYPVRNSHQWSARRLNTTRQRGILLGLNKNQNNVVQIQVLPISEATSFALIISICNTCLLKGDITETLAAL